MSMRDDSISLKDMLSRAREAVALLGDTSRENFWEQRVLQLALTHLVEIVGEAANRVTEDTRKAHPEIPWPRIIGMRNRLVHGYDVIDYDMLWDTVTNDLPPLSGMLEAIVGKED
jgi:uncharacterized protein with HEPN domain